MTSSPQAATALTIVATVIAPPGQEAALEEVLRGLVAPSRSDPGSVRYDLHRSLDNPRMYVFYEIWADRDSFENHLGTPHLANFKAKAATLVESLEIRVLEMISTP